MKLTAYRIKTEIDKQVFYSTLMQDKSGVFLSGYVSSDPSKAVIYEFMATAILEAEALALAWAGSKYAGCKFEVEPYERPKYS